MVPIASIVGMFSSMALFFALMGAALYYFHKKSKVVESGYLGAFGLGASAYFWAMVLLLISASGILQSVFSRNSGEGGAVPVVLIPLLATLFATIGLVWAGWLTNAKKASHYRGIAVGIGFGLAEATLYYVIPNVSNIRHAFEINQGTFRPIMEAAQVKPENIEVIFSNLTETKAVVFYMEGLERSVITLLYVAMMVVWTKSMHERRIVRGVAALAGMYLAYMGGVTTLTEWSKISFGGMGEPAWNVFRYLFFIVLAILYTWLAKRAYHPPEDVEKSYFDEGLL